ncbi:regulator of G-protein signaling 18 isoform X2 [Electrophorus electricus]|uniref:regulator of G-protein signaling 18 isoform X2 n=1 Tax=Electrophorus electricus TaxID=8005 RepID=UPI0015CFC88E|nr:regulator of G-protein signaling 18 isoform X2 [Electrophorus electricus]
MAKKKPFPMDVEWDIHCTLWSSLASCQACRRARMRLAKASTLPLTWKKDPISWWAGECFSATKKEVSFKMLGETELLASRMKDSHSRHNDKGKEKNKKSRLSLLLAKSGSHENVSPEKKPLATAKPIPPDVALRWSDSFEDLLGHPDGLEAFTRFLRTEFSEENIEFWLACEEYKIMESATKLQSMAKQIYAVFIDTEAPKESSFDVAQKKIYTLMKKDCFPRFLSSDIYLDLTKRKGPSVMTRRRSRSFVFSDRSEGTGDWF